MPPVKTRRPASLPAKSPLEATAASAMRERICSQALATTLQTLAVVLEPPATGAGGRSESPSSTVILSSSVVPSRSDAVSATTV